MRLTTLGIFTIILLFSQTTASDAAFGTSNITNWSDEQKYSGPEPKIDTSSFESHIKPAAAPILAVGDPKVTFTDGSTADCRNSEEAIYFIPVTTWTTWQRNIYEDYLRNTHTPGDIEDIIGDTPAAIAWNKEDSKIFKSSCGPSSGNTYFSSKISAGHYYVYAMITREESSAYEIRTKSMVTTASYITYSPTIAASEQTSHDYLISDIVVSNDTKKTIISDFSVIGDF